MMMGPPSFNGSARPSSSKRTIFSLAAVLVAIGGFPSFALAAAAKEEDWQRCDSFMAPSENGWGVYAARSFQRGEIVEISPVYLPMEKTSVEIQSSILNDYVHTYYGRGDEEDEIGMHVLVFGLGSLYNHHANPNLEIDEYGKEPFPTGDGVNGSKKEMSNAIGFSASRDIAKGEQLHISYGNCDAGEEWFEERHIQIGGGESKGIASSDMALYQSEYCSKIQAGIGRPSWEERIIPAVSSPLFSLDSSRLAPSDAGVGDARALTNLKSGDRIEISLGLVLSGRVMTESAVAPFLIRWDDWNPDNQRTLRNLRKKKQLTVSYQECDSGSGWEQSDAFVSYNELVILPVGNLALVRRVGSGKKSNCRVKIREKRQAGSKALTLELIATKKIKKGEILMLDMQPAGTPTELAMLKEEMELTGQPYHSSVFVDVKDEL